MKQDLTISIGLELPDVGREHATGSKSYRLVQRNGPVRRLELMDEATQGQDGDVVVGTVELGTHNISFKSRIDHVTLQSSQEHKISQVVSSDVGRILMSETAVAPMNVSGLVFRIADEAPPKDKVQVNSSLPAVVPDEPRTSQLNDELQANFQHELDLYQTENSLPVEENLRVTHDTRSSPPATPKQQRELVKDTPATGTRFKQLETSAEMDAEATEDEDEVHNELQTGNSPGQEDDSRLDDSNTLIDDEDESFVHDFSKKDGTLEISLDKDLYEKDENWTPEPSTALPSLDVDEAGLESKQMTNRDARSPGMAAHTESTGTEQYSTPNEDPALAKVDNAGTESNSPQTTRKRGRKRGRKRKTPETEENNVDNAEPGHATPQKRLKSTQSSQDFTTLTSDKSARKGKKYGKRSSIRPDEPATPQDILLDPPVLVFSNSAVAEDKAVNKWLRASKATVEKSIDGNNFDVLVVGKGEIKRTSKLLMAAALGKRVVTDDWLLASHKAKAFLSPDPYIIPEQDHWGYDPTDLSRRTSLLSGYTLHITPTLKREYGDGYKDIEALAKTVGVAKVVSRKVAKKGDNDGVVFMAKDRSDPEVDAIHARDASCFNKEFLPMSVLRGEANVESDEFTIL